jgi:predicted nucleic acid-binding protein
VILYLDTSSLVKLYVEEEGSDLVHLWVEAADVVATSRVALPEMLAAVARRWREGDLSDDGFNTVRGAITGQWQDLAVVNLNEVSAGNLAVRHGLRGFDAVHLAAALDVLSAAGSRGIPMAFSSFDGQLNRAAHGEGLEVRSSVDLTPSG